MKSNHLCALDTGCGLAEDSNTASLSVYCTIVHKVVMESSNKKKKFNCVFVIYGSKCFKIILR